MCRENLLCSDISAFGSVTPARVFGLTSFLKGLFSCFLAELSPVFTHQQPSVLPPFQYHPPVCCPGISPACPGLHGFMKGTIAASGDPNSAELTLGSGNCRAGEMRKAHKASEGTFFLPESYNEECTKGQIFSTSPAC